MFEFIARLLLPRRSDVNYFKEQSRLPHSTVASFTTHAFAALKYSEKRIMLFYVTKYDYAIYMNENILIVPRYILTDNYKKRILDAFFRCFYKSIIS